jgi:DNA-directed RNA polymerase subunit beta'
MVDTTKFDQLRIGLASPEEIRRWSRGEVKKPETINYRTFRPEPDGLFCERIFGPTRDWECHCGKYRKIKFRGITCDRCGVEVTRAKVRRERMGHIELASPVSHIWYLKGVPSPMSLLLDISPRPLEKVVYFASHIITSVDYPRLKELAPQIKQLAEEAKVERQQKKEQRLREIIADQQALASAGEASAEEEAASAEQLIKEEEKALEEFCKQLDQGLQLLLGPKLDGEEGLREKQLLPEPDYRALQSLAEILVATSPKKYDQLFRAALGAEAIRELLKGIDLEALSRELRVQIKDPKTSAPKRTRAVKRLEIVESFCKSRNRPEWMVLGVMPVIPPELRPMVQLDGGRFATSDLNDLYRRIINRNNRLKKIKLLNAPESIINHERRLLQEAVDALIDNGRRSRPVTGSNNRPLKSLSDMLKGKEGRFRKNLLGKRVDYSGRSVIVVGPHLKLHQCGLPREMALELFKPFVMKRLVEKGYTTNVKTAKKMVDRVKPEVWDALEEVIKDHPILLNRAPTLHRLGIQAFEPVLVDGKAIQIHPLVCPAFNADFDGDMMAAHVPLSAAAQAEARILMLATENLFKPANGTPIATPIREIVLGCYYLTQKHTGAPGSGRTFAGPPEAILAYHSGKLDLHADIRVRLEGMLVETTVGRLIFNEVLPPKLRQVDRLISQDELFRLVTDCYDHYGIARTVRLLDDLKDLGFRFATSAGVTISITDMDIPRARRGEIIARTEEQVRRTNLNYERGLITPGERTDQVCRLWTRATDEVADAIVSNIDPFNPIFMIADSGARSTLRQITQIAGMRGLMADPFGRFIEDLPIKSNFHEGLNVLEYFVSTHGARKGLADTALRTADAGYLTRRLVDVAQDVIIREQDCGTGEAILVSEIRDGPQVIETLRERIEGRRVPQDVLDPRTDRVLLRTGREITASADPPCPDCGAELEELFQCESCGRLLDRVELSLLYQHFTQLAAPEATGAPTPPGAEGEPAAQESPPAAAEEAIPSLLGFQEVTAQQEMEPAAAEPPSEFPVSLLLEETSCPDCDGQFRLLKGCTGCERHFAPDELTPALIAICRVVEECESFLRTAANLRVGELAPVDLVNPFTGELVLEQGKLLRKRTCDTMLALADKLREKGGLALGQVLVRSPLTCELRQGICAHCYGRDLASGRQVEVGEAVGIIAAQSIGEPGTQLTMRTFHTGGVAAQYLTGVAEVKKKKQEALRELFRDRAAGHVTLTAAEAPPQPKEKPRADHRGEIETDRRLVQQMLKVLEEEVKGLLRVVELFEARRPKGQAIVSEVDGVVADIQTTGIKRLVIQAELPLDLENPEGLLGELAAEDLLHPKSGDVLLKEGREITPQVLTKLAAAKLRTVKIQKRHLVPYRGDLPVKKGDRVRAGDRLTDGPLDPQKVLQMKGARECQDYLVREIQAVYRSQGVDINEKHIEVIARQMMRKCRVLTAGDTELLPGKSYDRFYFDQVNQAITTKGAEPATAERILLGITEASLATESFLSAASFQKTTRVLTDAAIQGKTDPLLGLKENVIIGRLIPAGTGMPVYRNLRAVGPPGEERLPGPLRGEAARLRASIAQASGLPSEAEESEKPEGKETGEAAI